MRAILHAADRFGLNDSDLQDVFCDNAERLLGLRAVDPEMGQKSYERALTIIPRGNHLLSKNPDRMAPGQWPPYFREARGCEVWDEADATSSTAPRTGSARPSLGSATRTSPVR